MKFPAPLIFFIMFKSTHATDWPYSPGDFLLVSRCPIRVVPVLLPG